MVSFNGYFAPHSVKQTNESPWVASPTSPILRPGLQACLSSTLFCRCEVIALFFDRSRWSLRCPKETGPHRELPSHVPPNYLLPLRALLLLVLLSVFISISVIKAANWSPGPNSIRSVAISQMPIFSMTGVTMGRWALDESVLYKRSLKVFKKKGIATAWSLK